MAEFVEALYSRLQAVPAVTNLVGTRAYPVRLPQGVTYPALRYDTIDEQRESALDSDMGLVRSRVQIDSFAATYLAAKQLATAVRGGLQRVAWTQAGVECLDALLEAVQDGYEADVDVYRVRHDFLFWYRE